MAERHYNKAVTQCVCGISDRGLPTYLPGFIEPARKLRVP